MLRLPEFELRLPGSAVEAAKILGGEVPRRCWWPADGSLAEPEARLASTALLVSLMAIPELRGVRNGTGHEELRVGATSLLNEVLDSSLVTDHYPALARAVASISSPPLRNMGTLGVNLCVDTRCTYYNQSESWRRSVDYCMKEDGTVCWVAPRSPRCWAHSASDATPVLCALGARVRLISAEGERTIPVTDLFRDDGIDYLSKAA